MLDSPPQILTNVLLVTTLCVLTLVKTSLEHSSALVRAALSFKTRSPARTWMSVLKDFTIVASPLVLLVRTLMGLTSVAVEKATPSTALVSRVLVRHLYSVRSVLKVCQLLHVMTLSGSDTYVLGQLGVESMGYKVWRIWWKWNFMLIDQ